MSSFKFRVLIDTDSNTEVFRDILISEKDNLESFYNTIIKAFEFEGGQMASFYKSNEEWDKGQEITLMDMGFNDDAEPVLIMKETALNIIITEPNQKLILVHDFMRMWCFLIELIETLPKNITKPQIILSVGDAPVESSKSLDGSGDMAFGETLELGDDFEDIFSDENDEDEPEDFQDEFSDTDYY